MKAACGHDSTDLRGGVCYGCWLQAKNLNISGETVAGWTFGRKPSVLRDPAIAQRIEAGNELQAVSTAMQAGGAVVEDRLQREVDKQTWRAKDAGRADGIVPLYADTPTGFETVAPSP